MKHVLISAISITRYLTTSSSKYLSCQGRPTASSGSDSHQRFWLLGRLALRRLPRGGGRSRPLRGVGIGPRGCPGVLLIVGCSDSADAAALLAAASARRPTRGHRPMAHRWAATGSPWQSTLRAAMAGNVLPSGQRSPDRVFCPVPGCPASMPGSRGWTSHPAMRPHLEDHAAGTLDGDVPQAYRARQHLDLCSVCGGLVSSRYNLCSPTLPASCSSSCRGSPCRCCPRSCRPIFGDSLRCKHPGPAPCPQSCPGRLGPMPFTSRQH